MKVVGVTVPVICHMVYSLSPVGLGSLSTQLDCQKATWHSRHAIGISASCHRSKSKIFALSPVSRSSRLRRQQEAVSCSAAAADISLPSPDGGEQYAASSADRTSMNQHNLAYSMQEACPSTPAQKDLRFWPRSKASSFTALPFCYQCHYSSLCW